MATITLNADALNKIVGGLSLLGDASAVGYAQELRILILEAEKKALEDERDALNQRVATLERTIRIQNGCERESDPCALLRAAALRPWWRADDEKPSPLVAACAALARSRATNESEVPAGPLSRIAELLRREPAEMPCAPLKSLTELLRREAPQPANSPLNMARDDEESTIEVADGDEDLYS
jgi:hypothetical protein